jgi:regulation of enolase protein 1 (concanavalin A-like superfamily)
MTSLVALCLALTLGYSDEEPKKVPWETVTPKDGGFTVEMPKKPSYTRSQTRNGPDGRIRILITGCETAAGTYIAYKFEFPTPFVKGAEEDQLTAERDGFAEEWKGKVISEKKVRWEGNPGRDFTIRGKPEDDEGTLTLRVRMFVVGKSIYALMVVSKANRELPKDAGRFLGSLTLGGAKPAAKGAAEGPGRPLEGWGMVYDSDKDCKVKVEDKDLSVEVPGKLHELSPDSGQMNAPRVVRQVEGDFTMQVRVAGEFKPAGKSTKARTVPYNGAGLLVWSDADNYIRLERAGFLRSGKIVTTVAFEEREGGHRGAVHNVTVPAGTLSLRLERKGGRVQGSYSSDGETWKALKPIDVTWAARMKVGVLAINTNSEPFTVKFGEFGLKAKELKGEAGKP